MNVKGSSFGAFAAMPIVQDGVVYLTFSEASQAGGSQLALARAKLVMAPAPASGAKRSLVLNHNSSAHSIGAGRHDWGIG